MPNGQQTNSILRWPELRNFSTFRLCLAEQALIIFTRADFAQSDHFRFYDFFQREEYEESGMEDRGRVYFRQRDNRRIWHEVYRRGGIATMESTITIVHTLFGTREQRTSYAS